MKLLKNLYDKISKDLLRKRLYKWRNIINKLYKIVGNWFKFTI